MSFKPNTTVYLCTGTGLDYNNSVWMHKYAYSNEEPDAVKEWWNTLFQWFKAHSIAEGFWYYSYTDPMRGYIDVGRTPLSNGSRGQSGLGNAQKQAEMDSNDYQFSETIKSIDWIVFANGEGGSPFDVQYCMVDTVTYINYNTARIYFTVDAILTYQKYFWLGRCFVSRDMEFGEWNPTSGDRLDQVPTLEHINTMPEPVGVSDSDFVVQKIASDGVNADTLDKMSFGAYTELFCSTDVDLQNIKSSQWASALPDFEPSPSTKIGDVDLGIGVYRVRDRVNKGFEDLGSYNAMEHILASYVLPKKVLNEATQPLEFVRDAQAIIKDEYKYGTPKILKLPTIFNDKNTITTETEDGYKAVNFKCYTAPLTYISISDKQGSSIEILPQKIKDHYGKSSQYYFSLGLDVNITAAPQMPSNLVILNLNDRFGSQDIPFMTLWQTPSYCMTPNASGYNQVLADNIAKNSSFMMTLFVVAGLALIATGVGAGIGAGAIGAAGAAGTAGAAGASTGVGSALTAGGSALAGMGVGLGGKTLSSSIGGHNQVDELKAIGLPKTAGGLPNGMTSFNMNSAGYEFFWCHYKTDYIKLADYMFSVIGYAQNAFRYPHINTRKRWCYVKLSTVNIRNIAGDSYDIGGVPFWARQQIESRLTNGVTFWNLRHALNESPIQDYKAIPSSSIKMNFVKRYGTSSRSPEMLDNADHDGGYASDYSDEAMN